MRGSRNFCQGGGWGGSLTARKQPGQRFFFCFLLVLNLFYSLRRGSNGFITEKTILFQRIEGVQLFWGGGGGVGGPGSKC